MRRRSLGPTDRERSLFDDEGGLAAGVPEAGDETADDGFEDEPADDAGPEDDEVLAAEAYEEGDERRHGAKTPLLRRQRGEPARRQNLPLRLVLGGAVVFVVALLVTAGAKSYRDLRIVRQREAELSVRISAAEERLEALRHRLQLLRDDPATLERLAREELGLVGPDDLVFVLPPQEDGEAPPADAPAAEH